MKQLLIYLLILPSSFLFAQPKEVKKEKDKVIVTGNKEYAEKKYTDAEANYRISKSKDLSGSKSVYNLGNAIYKQELPSEVAEYLVNNAQRLQAGNANPLSLQEFTSQLSNVLGISQAGVLSTAWFKKMRREVLLIIRN